ncbi:hypothetical protein, partial [Mesorhizobium sp. LNHC229A00]|uniref:hypothetical protein n=1 Tax=Mesorhizobium sp. LNHC229A00 TaxID=1287240 RepID=UPI000517CA5D
MPEAPAATGPLITLHRLEFTGRASAPRQRIVVVQLLTLNAGPTPQIAFDFGRVASKTTAHGLASLALRDPPVIAFSSSRNCRT